MSLRILLTHVYAWPEVRRGGERYLHEVAAGLARNGHEVRIVTTSLRAHRARISGVDVTYLRRREFLQRRYGELGPEIVFGGQAFMRAAVRRIDVWHALGTADASAASALGRLRSVRSVYTDLGISSKSWREHRPDRRLYHAVIRHVDRYICLSEAAAAGVRDEYARNVDVLGGGVALSQFAPAEARNPTPALLFPASVDEPRKNFSLLLDAVGILRQRRPDVELWLAGPGDPAPALARASARAREAVVGVGVGEVADLPAVYGRAWTTVLPARGEAFGLVVLESLACGTPVVTLDEGGPADLVRPGVGAKARETPESLADACEVALDLAADPQTALRCRAVAEPFDWQTGVIPRLERIYGDA